LKKGYAYIVIILFLLLSFNVLSLIRDLKEIYYTIPEQAEAIINNYVELVKINKDLSELNKIKLERDLLKLGYENVEVYFVFNEDGIGNLDVTVSYNNVYGRRVNVHEYSEPIHLNK
jgi:hypothetical protein